MTESYLKSTNRLKAVALRYRQGEDNAPVITASGQGYTAEKIIELAKQYGVPVHEDEGLAEALRSLKLGDEIPSELYQAVAGILAFIFQADQQQESYSAKENPSVEQ